MLQISASIFKMTLKKVLFPIFGQKKIQIAILKTLSIKQKNYNLKIFLILTFKILSKTTILQNLRKNY